MKHENQRDLIFDSLDAANVGDHKKSASLAARAKRMGNPEAVEAYISRWFQITPAKDIRPELSEWRTQQLQRQADAKPEIMYVGPAWPSRTLGGLVW